MLSAARKWAAGCPRERTSETLLGRQVPRIILIAAAVVVAYLVFSSVVTGLKSHGLAHDENAVRQEIADLQRQRGELVAIREYLSSDEYVESVARRVLGLVKPGETRVIVTSPDAGAEQPPAEATPAAGTWWESLFGP
jgi:cell division protein FtsB